jgi:DNA-binding beta-propeller fold protein YncE
MNIHSIQINIFLLVLLATILISCKNQKSNSETESTIEYILDANWPELNDSFQLGTPTGIDFDSQGNIIVFHSGPTRTDWITPFPDDYITEETILIIDKDQGKILNTWGANRFIMPHGLTVDNQDNIWLTDVARNQVFKFSISGNLLMVIGEEGVAGKDSSHFDLPTDVAIDNDGSIYVSDGYGNSRIVKFSPKGEYLLEWGKKGIEHGQFHIPHSIDIDQNGNVYVADRENSRIQVFDTSGNFLWAWKNNNIGRIFSVKLDKHSNTLFAIDYVIQDSIPKGSDVILFNSKTEPITRFGRSGNYNGSTTWYHDIAISTEGRIYVVDILGRKIERFILKNAL